MSVTPWLAIPCTIACALLYTSLKSSDPYGSYHISLNKDPDDDDDDDEPRTEWLNMGLWRDTDKFPKACEALALHLFRAAALKQHGTILDVGHGSGDSLLLLLSHPDVPRPDVLCGITSLPGHRARSKARIGHLLSSNDEPDTQTRVFLFNSDAVFRSGISDSHPLSTDSPYHFDTVLALDCAYHLRTRFEFLGQSFAHLVPGGRIALADICFERTPSVFATLMLSLVFRVMPQSNVITKQQYVGEMERIGYINVQLEDITQSVFPGFRKFLGGQGLGFRLFGRVLGWLEQWQGRFVIVTATKPS
ncbi:hypothetical protein OF83DRAFT_1092674 [Amylostereum chailletii]|nr:hypothetical protein OF83DRAFT_1092674 [Amylostereum chailletii]